MKSMAPIEGGPRGAPPVMDPRMVASLRAVAGAAAFFALLALLRYGPSTAASVAAGGGAAVANLYVIARIVRGLVRGAPERGSAGWSGVAMLKLLALFGGVSLLLVSRTVDPIPFLVGYAALPVGLVLGSLWSDQRDPPSDDDSG